MGQLVFNPSGPHDGNQRTSSSSSLDLYALLVLSSLLRLAQAGHAQASAALTSCRTFAYITDIHIGVWWLRVNRLIAIM
eukprot:1012635-Pelagomonas_calceolata.AAC.1